MYTKAKIFVSPIFPTPARDPCISVPNHSIALIDGNHSVLLTHILHFNLHLNDLNPFMIPRTSLSTPLRQNRLSSASWNDFYHNYPMAWANSETEGWNSSATTPYTTPCTPAPDQLPTNDNDDDDDDDGGDNDKMEQGRFPSSLSSSLRRPSSWIPSPSTLLSSLLPTPLISKLSTFSSLNLHLKLTTRLDFNDNQRIWRHEDSYSIKDIFETIPLVRPVYFMNRRVMAFIASKAGSVLLSGGRSDIENGDDENIRDEEQARRQQVTYGREGDVDIDEKDKTGQRSVVENTHEGQTTITPTNPSLLPKTTTTSSFHFMEATPNTDTTTPQSQLLQFAGPIGTQGIGHGHLKALPAAPQMSSTMSSIAVATITPGSTSLEGTTTTSVDPDQV